MTYTATISGAKDAAGDPMNAPVTWSFTTTTTAQPAPAVTYTPAAGATNVAVSVAPTATFNEAVQSSTIGWSIKNGSATVAATGVYNSTSNTLTMTPSAPLAYGTTYTVTISGAQSSTGVAMTAPVSWSFTTDPAAPALTSVTPASGATGVSITSPVTATFNEAVQSGTIGFTLTSSSGTVSTALLYSSSTNTATWTPSAALAYGTTYTATVTGSTSFPCPSRTRFPEWLLRSRFRSAT
jgi:methionine-rich copper-binding protein CopC